jgi:hypothetical protein
VPTLNTQTECHPDRSGGICSAPLGPPEFFVSNPNTRTEVSSRPERTRISCHVARDKAAYAPFRTEGRMKCDSATNSNRKSGVAQWRDLLFTIPRNGFKWKRSPTLCHPDRSGGICSAPLGPPESLPPHLNTQCKAGPALRSTKRWTFISTRQHAIRNPRPAPVNVS